MERKGNQWWMYLLMFMMGKYGKTFSVDWFQPYKHLNYSVGAIYIAILPRDVRYKVENVLLIGIMPGPHEC